MSLLNRRGLLAAAAVVPALALGASAFAQGGEVTISHYFTGELGLKALNEQITKFEADTGYTMKNSPIGHEDFKTDILVRAAGDSLPDVFSYWAGARTQFVADSGSLHPIDEMWNREGLDDIVAKSVADSATMYNGQRYLGCPSTTTTRACSTTRRFSRTPASPICPRAGTSFSPCVKR